jgi:hypothetical protein
VYIAGSLRRFLGRVAAGLFTAAKKTVRFLAQSLQHLALGLYAAGKTMLNFLYQRLWPPLSPIRVLCWNFATLILLGLALSYWIFVYTDYFDSFVALLSFGGILSWLALVSKLVPEADGKTIHEGIFGFFLKKPYAWVAYLVLLAAGAGATAAFGTIQLESAQSGADYQAAVYPADESPPAPEKRERVPAASRVRFPFLPCWRERKYRVAVKGYPTEEVTLGGPWGRKVLRVPDSFQQAVLLVGPSALVFRQLRSDTNSPEAAYEFQATVTINGQEFALERAYEGQAFWLGGTPEESLDIPKLFLDEWAEPLSKYPEKAALLLGPAALEQLIAEASRKQLHGVWAQEKQRWVQVRIDRLKGSEREKEWVKTPPIPVLPAAVVRTSSNRVQCIVVDKK